MVRVFKKLLAISTEFEDQNRKLANDAENTLTSVREEAKKGAKQYTKALSDDFAKALSWKAAGLVSAICACIFALTLFSVWLLVPSKAEIAERQTKFDSLAAAKIAHNVVNGQDGEFYARIKPKSCFIGTDKYQYCEFR